MKPLPKNREKSVLLRQEIPSSVDPPISQGSVIGKLILEGEGFPRRETNLLASQDVEVKSYALYYMSGLGAFAGLVVLSFWRRRGLRKKRV